MTTASLAQQMAFFGSPFPFPGTMQAQDFDWGGEGLAYHDCDTENQGGAYRLDDGVDVGSSNEGRYSVGWVCEGEWIEYTVAVEDAGNYVVEVRAATIYDGALLRLEFYTLDGQFVTSTDDIAVPNTGGWSAWTTMRGEIALDSRLYVMRFVNASDTAFNVTWYRLRAYDPVDYELDEDFDGHDAALFAGCLGGPGVEAALGCAIDPFSSSDLDGDDDTDARDLARLQWAASGVVLLDEGDWELVWSDEFDYTGLPDPAKWRYEVGYQIRNDEAQYYTDAENAVCVGGNLIIEARKEQYPLPWGGFADYTAASMSPTTSWTYGRFEVRAKLPTGVGMWPAIWMLGDRIGQVGWPACGEIDIMENVGYDPDTIHGSVHTPAYYHVIGTQRTSTLKSTTGYTAFHVYTVEWSPEKIDFYFDRVKYMTFRNEGTGNDVWPFWNSHHLKLNIAVGGGWGGAQGIDDNIFPQQFVIDYVRVYQK